MNINLFTAEQYHAELIHEYDDGKTQLTKTYDCDTLQEALDFLDREAWSWYQTIKVYVWIMDNDTGEVHQVLLR